MDADPLIGRTMGGRYRVDRIIGRGGMATVYSAHDEQRGESIALKVLKRELARDPMVLKRFQREGKASALLRHPNMVLVHDWGVEDEIAFIAMELAPGMDLLRALSKERPMRQIRAVLILAQVAAALAEAHEKGIVHRDLKPENVMLISMPDEPGGERAKVLDFGIAKVLDTSKPAPAPVLSSEDSSYVTTTALTRVGTIVGTPAYMSPEQCRGSELDGRSDLYACGVLLYQLVTGELPFTGETPLHTAMKHIHGQPKPPSTLRKDLHPGLEKTILKALAKWPGERHQTASALRDELVSHIATLPDRPSDFVFPATSEPARPDPVVQRTLLGGGLGATSLGGVRLGRAPGAGAPASAPSAAVAKPAEKPAPAPAPAPAPMPAPAANEPPDQISDDDDDDDDEPRTFLMKPAEPAAPPAAPAPEAVAPIVDLTVDGGPPIDVPSNAAEREPVQSITEVTAVKEPKPAFPVGGPRPAIEARRATLKGVRPAVDPALARTALPDPARAPISDPARAPTERGKVADIPRAVARPERPRAPAVAARSTQPAVSPVAATLLGDRPGVAPRRALATETGLTPTAPNKDHVRVPKPTPISLAPVVISPSPPAMAPAAMPPPGMAPPGMAPPGMGMAPPGIAPPEEVTDADAEHDDDEPSTGVREPTGAGPHPMLDPREGPAQIAAQPPSQAQPPMSVPAPAPSQDPPRTVNRTLVMGEEAKRTAQPGPASPHASMSSAQLEPAIMLALKDTARISLNEGGDSGIGHAKTVLPLTGPGADRGWNESTGITRRPDQRPVGTLEGLGGTTGLIIGIGLGLGIAAGAIIAFILLSR